MPRVAARCLGLQPDAWGCSPMHGAATRVRVDQPPGSGAALLGCRFLGNCLLLGVLQLHLLRLLLGHAGVQAGCTGLQAGCTAVQDACTGCKRDHGVAGWMHMAAGWVHGVQVDYAVRGRMMDTRGCSDTGLQGGCSGLQGGCSGLQGGCSGLQAPRLPARGATQSPRGCSRRWLACRSAWGRP